DARLGRPDPRLQRRNQHRCRRDVGVGAAAPARTRDRLLGRQHGRDGVSRSRRRCRRDRGDREQGSRPRSAGPRRPRVCSLVPGTGRRRPAAARCRPPLRANPRDPSGRVGARIRGDQRPGRVRAHIRRPDRLPSRDPPGPVAAQPLHQLVGADPPGRRRPSRGLPSGSAARRLRVLAGTRRTARCGRASVEPQCPGHRPRHSRGDDHRQRRRCGPGRAATAARSRAHCPVAAAGRGPQPADRCAAVRPVVAGAVPTRRLRPACVLLPATGRRGARGPPAAGPPAAHPRRRPPGSSPGSGPGAPRRGRTGSTPRPAECGPDDEGRAM
ncbi:MAG: hypothetical protein AVDCRST_MAG52-2569, partial [uncultured Blastococcus sp.]